LVPFFIAAVVIVALDQVTKHLAVSGLDDGSVTTVIDGILTFRLTYNSGGAFGFGQGMPGFFLAASVVIVVLVVVIARRVDDPRWVVPLGCILGGGVGNLIDRLVREPRGRVVDFIDLQVWPLFNIADSAIVLGVAALFWLSFRAPKHES
jgi:signal peptidase II